MLREAWAEQGSGVFVPFTLAGADGTYTFLPCQDYPPSIA